MNLGSELGILISMIGAPSFIYVPIKGDDPRRFFIFLPARKAYNMLKAWEERDPEGDRPCPSSEGVSGNHRA